MSTEPIPTHYPHCPYCNAEWAGKGYYVCGSFNNSGCQDTFPQSALCKVRAELAATKRELEAMREQYESLARRSAESRSTLCRLRVERDQAEARVRELEGLPLGNEDRRDGGIWVEVFIPTERLGGANCEGEECPTLGDAMQRKE